MIKAIVGIAARHLLCSNLPQSRYQLYLRRSAEACTRSFEHHRRTLPKHSHSVPKYSAVNSTVSENETESR